mmetsp:Transcript_57467/g.136646  ORF Transcript_57467/g.136646 Transcript_57467/m.136646 type:complete len:568 (-) Transcript_57467:73-1776(-)
MASSAVADNVTSRDDARKAKQLQEARQSGAAAPETDAATGKIINPHNPQFITQAPWYLNQSQPSLKHHQAWNLKTPGTKEWYKRGNKGDVKTKFAKGACANCGATTHSSKDCMDRPRAVGAKWNGKNLQPDEYVEDLNLDWDGKHDRWNGYQPDDYAEVIKEWERVEEERRKKKALQMEERAKLKEKLKAQKRALKKARRKRRKQLRRQVEGADSGTDGTDTDGTNDSEGDSDTDTDTDSDSDASDDEDLGEKMKDFDKTTTTVGQKDDKLRTTTRNLRIREDTAKYLLNLDPNSAYYDPKSRSMRQNPLAHLPESEQGTYRGDNYMRASGDAKALTELTVFAWDAYKNGAKVHDIAQPTQALKMHEIYKERKDDLKDLQRRELLEKYGGEEHLDAPAELIFSQNDNYVEYTRDGRILKGRERAYIKSKYEEDVIPGNHSSTWGSWFDPQTGKWGFACCRQTMKNAYCLAIKADALADGPSAADDKADESTAPALEAEAAAADDKEQGSSSSDSDSSSGDGKDDAKKAEKRKARALKGLKKYGTEAPQTQSTGQDNAEEVDFGGDDE